MTEINGASGELIDRLVELLNCDVLGDGWWYNLSFFVRIFLGGEVLSSALPNNGVEPKPGTVGEMERQRRELVARDRYFELIRERLRELVAGGLYEPFLVRSLRDALRRELEMLADTVTANRSREEIKNFIESQAEDPSRISAFRAILAETGQSADEISDEQITVKLSRMTQFLAPIPEDDAFNRWASITHWDERSKELLPEAVFDKWRDCRMEWSRPTIG